MVTITYETLNDLTHEVASLIREKIGLPIGDAADLYNLNDTLTGYLQRYGVLFEDE